jgi:hypothetical protein
VTIAEQIQASGEQSPLVPLALGLVSFFERAAEALSSGDADGLPPLADDDPLLLAGLGIIALRSVLDRWLALTCAPDLDPDRERGASAGDGAGAAPASRASAVERSLMR